MLNFGLLILQN